MPCLRLESSLPSKMAGFEGLYEERYCYFFIIHAIRRFFYFAAKRGYITLKLRFSFSCIVPNCMLHIVTWLLEFAEAYFGELIAELQLLA